MSSVHCFSRVLISRILIAALSAMALMPPTSFGAEAVPVAVTRAMEAPLVEEVLLTGTVTSPQTAVLSAAVGGLVARMHKDVGARVQRGDVLMQLDTELAEIAQASARAELASAEAALAEARRRVDEAQPLMKQNNIAATEVRAREAQAKIAAAAVESARAAVNRQSAELARHTVKAPFAGAISRKLTEIGEWVAPGNEVMELVSINNLRVDFQVPQRYYPRIDDNTKVIARFDALPEREYTGRIISTVPVSDPGGRTFLLRADLTENNPHLTPGMSAQGILQLHTAERGVLVPRDAVIRYADGRVVVWVVNQSGDVLAVEERVVELGLSAAGRVEIRRGLEAGALVVTRGNEALQPGQPVVITETPTAGE